MFTFDCPLGICTEYPSITKSPSSRMSSSLTGWARLLIFFFIISPPFKYYDLNDASQILEDENTLPDFEIMDPKEKLFVESAIKTVQNIYAGMDKSLLPYADDNNA